MEFNMTTATRPDIQTVYIQIVREGDEFHPDGWRPWAVNDPDDREQTIRMAIHKFLRESGGFDFGESHTLKVYHYDRTAPKYPSGRPMKSMVTEFRITRVPPAESDLVIDPSHEAQS